MTKRTISAGAYVKNGLAIFAREVNLNRQFAALNDGLKPVYRRALYTLLNQHRVEKLSTLSGDVLKIHPHGDKSAAEAIANLVAYGFADEHGTTKPLKTIYGDNMTHAAPRYCGATLNSAWRKFFDPLMPYIPMVESENEGYDEPAYLPTPFPLVFQMGRNLALAQGTNAKYPMFTLRSIAEAYKRNDPNYLKAPYGMSIDYEKSNLKAIWETGIGSITYNIPFKMENTPAGTGLVVRCKSCELFEPKFPKIEEWKSQGYVSVVDMSDENGQAVVFLRNNNVRTVTDEMIREEIAQACSSTQTYRITIADTAQSTCYVIPMKEWCKFTFQTYCSLVNKYKEQNIKRTYFEMAVQTWLKPVANIILKDDSVTDQQIYDQLKDLPQEPNLEISIKVIQAIMRKTVSALRRSDTSSALKSLQKDLKSYQKIDAKSWVYDTIAQTPEV